MSSEAAWPSEAASLNPRSLQTAPNGVPLLQAPTLDHQGVIHAFTTRLGGTSPAPFATLNLGRAVGDAAERVRANRRRVLEAMGCERAAHVEASQVHGRGVAVVGKGQAGGKIDGVDALVTGTPGVVVAIHAADCVPILVWDPAHGVVGAAHAGWRGTAAGVAAAVVDTLMTYFGTDPADLRVGMGPAIGPCHYEVDGVVAAAFEPWPWRAAVLRPGRPGHWSLDLMEANRRQLAAIGIADDHIWTSGLCTACHPDLFFSYRRDGITGRMGALIALR